MKTKINGILTLLLAFMVQMTFAQERTISGVVTDGMGPVSDISVKVKNTDNGTVTDFDGNYAIKAKSGDTLVFTHVAYGTVEKVVGSTNKIDVSLADSGQELEQVVVTAFGIKRKPDELTSSTQLVKSKELTKAAASSITQALTGKVSGLRITNTSSGVSGNTSITLRGSRSFSGNNGALIVIDGVLSNASLLNALDPETIESTNIIKGASGSALYGYQGANGVIVVTTKKGTGAEGKGFKVSFKSSTDFEKVAYLPERQTRYGQGWASGGQFTHFVYENGAWGPEFDGSTVPVGLPLADGTFRMMRYETLGSDKIKEFFKTGTTFQNSVSISGGDKDAYANISLRNLSREYIIQGDKINRTSVAIRAGKQLGKLNLSTSIQYIKSNIERTNSALYGDLLQTATNIDITQFANGDNASHWNGYFNSPYWRRDNIRRFDNNNRINAGVTLAYELNEHISFNSTVNMYFSVSDGYRYNNGYRDSDAINALSGFRRTIQSSYGESDRNFRTKYGDFLINLDYNLTDNWKFNSHIGTTAREVRDNQISFNGVDLTIPGLYNISNISGTPTTTDYKSIIRNGSVFADATFGYKKYLFLNFTGRNDWLSWLDKSERSLFYPSAGISFIPTKAFENFGGEILNKMKLAYSYTKSGNASGVAYADIVDTYTQASGTFYGYGNFPFGNSNSFIPTTSATDKLIRPEFLISNEVNLTMEFLKSRIRLDLAGYLGTVKDQINSIATSFTSGLRSNRINIGEAETEGFEIDLGLTPIKNENFKWDLNLSFAKDKMTVTKVSDQSNAVRTASHSTFVRPIGVFAQVGEVYPTLKGTDFQRDPQGRVIIAANGQPLINSEFVVLGQATPKYILGLNSAFDYKNFTLGVTADYRGGHKFYSDLKYQLAWTGNLVESAENGRQEFIFPNSVIETSPGVYVENTSVPTGSGGPAAFLNYYSGNYNDVGSNLVVDASAFKVREISLSYELPESLIGKTGLQNIVIAAQARNPFTILAKENRGYADPEANTGSSVRRGNTPGISEVSNNPTTRTFGFSLSLTF